MIAANIRLMTLTMATDNLTGVPFRSSDVLYPFLDASPDDTTSKLLNLVVRKERPDLADLGEQLVGQQNGFKIKMKELEDNILYKLATAEGMKLNTMYRSTFDLSRPESASERVSYYVLILFSSSRVNTSYITSVHAMP